MTSEAQRIAIPLLDGDTFIIDNSRLESFTICPRRGEYSIIRKRIPSQESGALTFGGAIHQALELRYRYGTGPYEPHVEARQMLLLDKVWQKTPTPINDYHSLGLAQKAIRDYNKRYPVEDFQLLTVQGKPLVEEPFAMPLGTVNGIKIVWSGRLDLPIKWLGRIFVNDHKTASQESEYYFQDFQNSAALKGYCWAFREKFGVEVAGGMINALFIRPPAKTARGKGNTFNRQPILFDNETLDDWRVNTLHIIEDLFRCADRGFFPMHTPTAHACVSKYGRCPYFDVCNLTPLSRGAYLESTAYKADDWSPLHKREVSVDEIMSLPEDQLQYTEATFQPTTETSIDVSELIG